MAMGAFSLRFATITHNRLNKVAEGRLSYDFFLAILQFARKTIQKL